MKVIFGPWSTLLMGDRAFLGRTTRSLQIFDQAINIPAQDNHTQRLSGRITVRCKVVTSIEELGGLEDDWEALRNRSQGSVFTSYDIINVWLKVFRKTSDPRLLIIDDNGDIVGIAPFMLLSDRLHKLPVRTISFIGENAGTTRLSFCQYGLLVEPERHDVLDTIMARMNDLDWNSLWFHYMKDTPSNRRFVRSIGTSWKGQEISNDTAITVDMGGQEDIMDRFGSKLHQKVRNLDRDHDIKFRTLSHEDIDRAVDAYAHHHMQRWEKRGGSIFSERRNSDFMKGIFDVSISKRKGFICELLVDDEVAAQQFGFIDGETAVAYRIGMDDRFSKYSPGLIVLGWTMEHLRDKGIRSIDLGEGTDDYKRHIGGSERALLGLYGKRGTIAFLSKIAKQIPRI